MSPIGRPFEDPSGLVLGHVVSTEPDGSGGLFLIVHGDWGALDWLHALGAAQTSRLFRFHSREVEDVGDALRLRADLLEGLPDESLPDESLPDESEGEEPGPGREAA